jgi:hypothetical protein
VARSRGTSILVGPLGLLWRFGLELGGIGLVEVGLLLLSVVELGCDMCPSGAGRSVSSEVSGGVILTYGTCEVFVSIVFVCG